MREAPTHPGYEFTGEIRPPTKREDYWVGMLSFLEEWGTKDVLWHWEETGRPPDRFGVEPNMACWIYRKEGEPKP